MTFKVNENDLIKAREFVSLLRPHDISVFWLVDMNDMSKCEWRIMDGSTGRLVHGGIGAMLNDLREIAYKHGLLTRPVRGHGHIRMAVNGRPIWTTANGG